MMNASPGAATVPSLLSLFGVAALLFLAGCATIPSTDQEPPDSEAVDIGYGEADRDHVVGSVATLNPDDPSVKGYRTLADMLVQIPGVRVVELPGREISVRIRGTDSVLGGAEPLWVVDGMMLPSGSGLGSMNPTTIASISVLKDAASTGIYGSRGANGVILIKTKRR